MPRSGQTKLGRNAIRYTLNWADTPGKVGAYAASPPGTKDSVALRDKDFKRQLRFPNPPAETVVTWCSYHASQSKAPVLFADGHADMLAADDVQGTDGKSGCRWRTQPRSE